MASPRVGGQTKHATGTGEIQIEVSAHGALPTEAIDIEAVQREAGAPAEIDSEPPMERIDLETAEQSAADIILHPDPSISAEQKMIDLKALMAEVGVHSPQAQRDFLARVFANFVNGQASDLNASEARKVLNDMRKFNSSDMFGNGIAGFWENNKFERELERHIKGLSRQSHQQQMDEARVDIANLILDSSIPSNQKTAMIWDVMNRVGITERGAKSEQLMKEAYSLITRDHVRQLSESDARILLRQQDVLAESFRHGLVFQANDNFEKALKSEHVSPRARRRAA